MDFTPRPHLMRSWSNQPMSWPTALAEMVDNSFDADASRVVIAIQNRVVVVEDDGKGVKDIQALGTGGAHDPHSTTAVGCYGVGLKDAWTFCGSTMTIDTVRNKVNTVLTIDPEELVKNNWQGADPVTSPCDRDNGTKITLPLARGRNTPDDAVVDTLSWLFTPALENGKQIVITRGARSSRKTLAACKLPQFVRSIQETFEINGKKVSIEIGIIKDGQQMYRGPFWIAYKHRIIKKSAIGAKGYSTMRIGGIIRLLNGWSLTKNKDDLSSCVEELESEIFTRIEPLLKQAEQLSEDLESQALKSELEGMLNSGLGAYKKEVRPNKGNCVGSIAPRNTGTKRRRAAVIQDGNGSIDAGDATPRRRGLKISWYSDEEKVVGDFDPLANLVRLNLSHPFIAERKDSQDRSALYTIAVALLCEHCCSHDVDNNRLLIPKGDFNQVFGGILATINPTKEENHVNIARR